MNFSGTIASDFMKLAQIPEAKRPSFINFAATDFATLRQSLIDYAKTVYPNDYKYFVESDLGMMFLELTAYMGAVMSMKADMLANENFLATAKQRSSVKKLLELIGIRMKGPLSSACDVKLTFDSNPNSDYFTADNDKLSRGWWVLKFYSIQSGQWFSGYSQLDWKDYI